VAGRSSGRLENSHAQAKRNAIRHPVAQVGGQRIDKDLFIPVEDSTSRTAVSAAYRDLR
jgi:hypothetical protein